VISISAGRRAPNVIGCTWYLAPSVHRERRRHAGGRVVARTFHFQHRAGSSGNYFFARVYSPPGLKRQRYTHVPNGGRGAIEDMGGCGSCSCRLLVIRERVVSIAAWKRCSIERQEGSLLLYTNHINMPKRGGALYCTYCSSCNCERRSHINGCSRLNRACQPLVKRRRCGVEAYQKFVGGAFDEVAGPGCNCRVDCAPGARRHCNVKTTIGVEGSGYRVIKRGGGTDTAGCCGGIAVRAPPVYGKPEKSLQ